MSKQSHPVAAQKAPYAMDVEAGMTYAWFACGLSQKQAIWLWSSWKMIACLATVFENADVTTGLNPWSNPSAPSGKKTSGMSGIPLAFAFGPAAVSVVGIMVGVR